MIQFKLMQIHNIEAIALDGLVFDSEKLHTYKIKFCVVDDVLPPIYIQAPFSYPELEILVAYFQFRFEEVLFGVSITHDDIVRFLETFYNCKKIENGKSEGTIDLYVNWDIWASYCDDILKLDYLDREGLGEELERLGQEIIENNPHIKNNLCYYTKEWMLSDEG
jgi:hypothetical protein